MSTNEPHRTRPAEAESLMAEFADLQKQQWKALDRAIYIGMTASEAQEFERRAQRINALQRALGQNLLYHEDRLQNP